MSTQEQDTLALWPSEVPLDLRPEVPPPPTGDAELDRDFAAIARIGRPGLDRNVLHAACQRLLTASRPGATRTLMAWVSSLLEPPFPNVVAELPPEWIARLPDEQRRHAHERARAALVSATHCALLVRQLIELVAAPLDVAPDGARAREPDAREVVPAEATLTDLLEQLAASRREGVDILVGLVARLTIHDPVLPWATKAAVRLDEPAAFEGFRDLLPRLEIGPRGVAAIALSKVVSIDRRPDWVDVMCPELLDVSWTMEIYFPFLSARTAEPLLRGLGYTRDASMFEVILASLRRVDDPSSAPAIEVFAAALPEGHPTKRLAAVLVKRLKRKREVITAASFEVRRGVGTDGGPIVVLPARVAREWRGASPEYGAPDAPPDDYTRACNASEDGGVGRVSVGGTHALVLPLSSTAVAAIADPKLGQTLVFVLSGTDLQLEAALREKAKWKKLRATLVLDDDDGLVLLDATRTVDSAAPDQLAREALARGTYAVHELANEDLHAVRLSAGKR